MQTCRTVQFFNMRKCNTGVGIQFGLKYIFYGFMVNISGRSTQGVKRSFKPSQIFKSKNVFEKMYYKCILLCSFVCFKFSFEASEILKTFSPKWNFFLVNIFSILVQLYEQKFICESNPLSGENDATKLYIALSTKTKVFTMGYKTEGKETIKV